jgi:hypothetical protein
MADLIGRDRVYAPERWCGVLAADESAGEKIVRLTARAQGVEIDGAGRIARKGERSTLQKKRIESQLEADSKAHDGVTRVRLPALRFARAGLQARNVDAFISRRAPLRQSD